MCLQAGWSLLLILPVGWSAHWLLLGHRWLLSLGRCFCVPSLHSGYTQTLTQFEGNNSLIRRVENIKHQTPSSWGVSWWMYDLGLWTTSIFTSIRYSGSSAWIANGTAPSILTLMLLVLWGSSSYSDSFLHGVWGMMSHSTPGYTQASTRCTCKYTSLFDWRLERVEPNLIYTYPTFWNNHHLKLFLYKTLFIFGDISFKYLRGMTCVNSDHQETPRNIFFSGYSSS